MAKKEGPQFRQFLQKFSRPNSSTVFSESPASVSRSPESEKKILETGRLPDYIEADLDILVVGINPGYFSAKERRYYAGPGNHFWKCLYKSQLISEPVTWTQDYRLLEWGIGLTNICARATRGQADLTKDEVTEGAGILRAKIEEFKPKIVVFNGKGIYEIFSGRKIEKLGLQSGSGMGVKIFVIPSSSPRSSLYPKAEDKIPFYIALRRLLDQVKAGGLINTEEFIFESGTIPTNCSADI